MNDWDKGNFKFATALLILLVLWILSLFFLPTAHAQMLNMSSATIQANQGSAQAMTNYATGNSIYIDQIGSGNNTYVIQNGSQDAVAGPGQNAMPIQGTGNTVKIRQGDPTNPIGANRVEGAIYGDFNYVGANQGITLSNQTNGQDTGGHYQQISITGSNNTVNTEQTNTNAGAHYLSTTVVGNYNTQTISQTDNTNKSVTATTQGNANTLAVSQSGLGSQNLNVNLLGNGNSATVTQSGNTGNSANISITNAGGPGSVNLTQTGGQNYNISTVCVTAGGCQPITVRQGN